MPFGKTEFSFTMFTQKVALFIAFSPCLNGPLCAQSSEPCTERPLGFKSEIRAPDAWELAWETAWPEVAGELAHWRSDNFEAVQVLWQRSAACVKDWRSDAQKSGLPASAAWLPLWVLPPTTCGEAKLPCGCPDLPADFWTGLARASAPQEVLIEVEAMEVKSGLRGASTPPHVRTGIRLLENLTMPDVHVVEPGNTLYSVARLHNISPSCLSQLNGVWDHLQPGMVLRIPNP